jgi:hypothetical protein
LPPYLFKPVFFSFCWKFFQVVGALLIAIAYCISTAWLIGPMHLPTLSFEDEWSSVSDQPVDFELPNSLVVSHLANFCSRVDPLACLMVIDSLSDKPDPSITYSAAAQDVVNRMNVFLLQEKSAFGASKCEHRLHNGSQLSFKQLPLVWDTGASQGLTPFLKDFIHYETCKIEVNDISKVNHVIGIGTVMYKFRALNGDDVFLPGVAFHLPTAAIRLLSPRGLTTSHPTHCDFLFATNPMFLQLSTSPALRASVKQLVPYYVQPLLTTFWILTMTGVARHMRMSTSLLLRHVSFLR